MSRRRVAGIAIAVVVGLLLLIRLTLAVYPEPEKWTGLGEIEYDKPAGKEVEPAKTLWDWLDLLIVPLVLVIGGLLFSRAQRQAERESRKLRDETEHELALDRQRENALQMYLDKMTELLLEKDLRTTKKEQVRDVARSRTLTVLRGLDGGRKGSLLQFLMESGLIYEENAIVDLTRADLSGADLSGARLREAYLIEADLIGADLTGADLIRADLSEARLIEADLTGAVLSKARLSEADLIEARLSEADLTGADLIEADLTGADLIEADLRGADLRGARLRGADLREAYLSGAYLSGTDLRGVDLSGAYLRGAVLSRADLTDAKVEPDQLAQTRSLEGATMPDGTKYEERPPAEVEAEQVFLTTVEFAAAMDATPAKVRRMIRDGLVNAEKRSGRWYIPAEEAERIKQ